jgi:hypothetical protein
MRAVVGVAFGDAGEMVVERVGHGGIYVIHESGNCEWISDGMGGFEIR